MDTPTLIRISWGFEIQFTPAFETDRAFFTFCGGPREEAEDSAIS